DLDRQAHALVHGHGQRLGAAHAAEARREDDAPAQRGAEVLARELRERLVRALEDALGPDVDPGTGRHLAVHHQPGLLELAEVVPGGPPPDEVGVGDQHARRPLVRPQDTDRLAALDQEGLVVLEPAELAHDRVEGRPAAGRAPRAAIDHERIGVLRDRWVEVVHEHPQGRLLAPALAAQLRAAWRADRPGAGEAGRHDGLSAESRRPTATMIPNSPTPTIRATASMATSPRSITNAASAGGPGSVGGGAPGKKRWTSASTCW